MKRATVSSIALALFCAVPAAADVINVGPQTSTLGFYTRGYYFTAPTAFTITGLRVAASAAYGAQSIEVVKFGPSGIVAGPPFDTPLFTNDFTSLFYTQNDSATGYIAASIAIQSGDVIGVLGTRGTTNSYGTGPYATSIAGQAVTLGRLGFQDALSSGPAYDLFTEDPVANANYGRIQFNYSTGATVPEPLAWGLLLTGFAFTGAAMRGRRGASARA